jgi:hypothetical protein
MSARRAAISCTVAEGAQAIRVRGGAGSHGARALCVPDTITLMRPYPFSQHIRPGEAADVQAM